MIPGKASPPVPSLAQPEIPLRSQLWRGSSWLTVVGVVMAIDALISAAGLLLDPSLVDGNPAWMKPLKFGISTCLFSLTVAFMIAQLQRVRRFAGVLGRILAVALTLEIALIDMQAARHTSSHFNTATQFDGAVYGAMGIGIATLFSCTTLLFAATWFEGFRDRALGWAVRLGLLMALASMGTGPLMTFPTPQQLAAAHAGQGLPRSGAHTVGAPDGGPSMPLTGWSADHGDLRIAHFLGLHCMQGVLLAWFLTRKRWSASRQVRAVWITAASFAGIFALTLWQALRGQAFLRPDTTTWLAWIGWMALTLVGLLLVATRQKRNGHSFNMEGAR